MKRKLICTCFLSVLLFAKFSGGVFALSNAKEASIVSFGEKLGLFQEESKKFLTYGVNGKKCALVPLCGISEHKECTLSLFSRSDFEYMKYYPGQKLLTEEEARKRYNRSLCVMQSSLPCDFTFIVDYKGKSVGEIQIVPFKSKNGIKIEITYVIDKKFSEKGIMSHSVRRALCFLRYLKNIRKALFGVTKLVAREKPEHENSNHILLKCGFKLKEKSIDDESDSATEYVYTFN